MIARPFFVQSLKDEFSSKPPLALAAASAQSGVGCDKCRSDRTEVGSTDIGVWIVEMRRVRHAECICFELEGEPFREFEVSKHAHVEIEIARTTDDVAAGISEESVQQPRSAGSHLLERCWIEVLA